MFVDEGAFFHLEYLAEKKVNFPTPSAMNCTRPLMFISFLKAKKEVRTCNRDSTKFSSGVQDDLQESGMMIL